MISQNTLTVQVVTQEKISMREDERKSGLLTRKLLLERKTEVTDRKRLTP